MKKILSESDKVSINKILINDYLLIMREAKIRTYREDLLRLLADLADHLHGLYDDRFDPNYSILLLKNYATFIESQLMPVFAQYPYLIPRFQKQIRIVKDLSIN